MVTRRRNTDGGGGVVTRRRNTDGGGGVDLPPPGLFGAANGELSLKWVRFVVVLLEYVDLYLLPCISSCNVLSSVCPSPCLEIGGYPAAM